MSIDEPTNVSRNIRKRYKNQFNIESKRDTAQLIKDNIQRESYGEQNKFIKHITNEKLTPEIKYKIVQDNESCHLGEQMPHTHIN